MTHAATTSSPWSRGQSARSTRTLSTATTSSPAIVLRLRPASTISDGVRVSSRCTANRPGSSWFTWATIQLESTCLPVTVDRAITASKAVPATTSLARAAARISAGCERKSDDVSNRGQFHGVALRVVAIPRQRHLGRTSSCANSPSACRQAPAARRTNASARRRTIRRAGVR